MSVAKVMATLSAVLALCLPASASAAWVVEGEELTGTAALASTAAVDEEPVLKGAGVSVQCSGKTLNSASPQISSPNALTMSSLEFTGCTTMSPCSLSASTIKTEPLAAEVTNDKALEDAVVIKPKTGTKITTLTFTGAECALEGLQPVTGKTTALLPTGEEESKTQAVKLLSEEASGELKLGSSSASLVGSALLKLASGFAFAGATGYLMARDKPVQFGNVPKGTEKKETVKILVMARKTSVTITSIKALNEEVFKVTDNCPRVETEGLSCQATVTFKPNKAAPPTQHYETFLIVEYNSFQPDIQLWDKLTGRNES